MSNPTTLRELVGLGNQSTAISTSALIIIDAQNTYREGIMQLEGVEPALVECQKLLQRFRAAGRPVIHIQHDAGPGSPYDVNESIGQIAEPVAPVEGEAVVVKNFPNSFVQTNLDEMLKEAGITDLILTGFMSHMCVNATARGAFSLGYTPTVVASCTATRSLPSPVTGEPIAAAQVHDAALAALCDLPSAVVASVADVPD